MLKKKEKKKRKSQTNKLLGSVLISSNDARGGWGGKAKLSSEGAPGDTLALIHSQSPHPATTRAVWPHCPLCLLRERGQQEPLLRPVASRQYALAERRQM